MPYKDPAQRKAASHQSYLRHRDRIQARRQELRATPGSRDAEYAKRRASAAAERAAASPSPSPTRPRQRASKEREASVLSQEYAQVQRDLKAAALARLAERGQRP